MALPTAVITYSATPIAFASLPTSLVMTSASSTPGTGGSSITGWQWYLLDAPPGSSASLLNATTGTCTLQNIDLPGSYRVFLVVEDNLGNSSVESPNPVQSGTAPFSFTVPPTTAFATITATTQYAALIKVAKGERNWLARGLWPLVDEIDLIRRDLGSGGGPSGGGKFECACWIQRARWIQPHDGSATADGSPSAPFNPVSAAANGFDGPWEQAIAVLNDISIADEPYTGRTIYALGGLYDEDVVITANAPWNIICCGLVQLGSFSGTTRDFTYYTSSSGLTFDGSTLRADLYIGGVGSLDGGFCFAITGTWKLKNPSAYVYLIRGNGIYTGVATSVLDTYAAGAVAQFRNCDFHGHFNIPNMTIDKVYNTTFNDALTCKIIQSAHLASFKSVTVTQAATNGYHYGFHACSFNTVNSVFTGPAGAARFDDITTERFINNSCSFSGGAGPTDVITTGRGFRPVFRVRNVITPGTTSLEELVTYTPPAKYVTEWLPVFKFEMTFALDTNGNTKNIYVKMLAGSVDIITFTTTQNGGFVHIRGTLTSKDNATFWVSWEALNAAGLIEAGADVTATYTLTNFDLGVYTENVTSADDASLYYLTVYASETSAENV